MNNNKQKKQMSLYSKIWYHIIHCCSIDLTKKISYITSAQIKNTRCSWYGIDNQFEPRLLCKMDTLESRPDIFKENGICLLSVKNGVYVLLKENIYIHLNTYKTAPNIIRETSDSMLLNIGNSEMTILDKLRYNNVLEHIIGEKILYGPLLGGRHRCEFDTNVGDISLSIKGAQYETDGCYETENTVCIVEVKSVSCKNFNIRQLYFPFREVYKKVTNRKKIISLFIYKDRERNIHIYKYIWRNHLIMNDVELIGYFKYVLQSS